MKTIHILHLEDNPGDANLVKTFLNKSTLTYKISWVDTKEKFEAAVLNEKFDIILGDYTIPGYDGLAALLYVKNKKPNIPFILISGTIGEENTIEIFRAGATDFITKGNLTKIERVIVRALNEIEEKNKREITEQRYRLIMENASCGFFIFDKNGIVLEINKYAEAVFGCSKDLIIGKDFREFVVPAEQECAAIQIQKILTEKHIGPIERQILQPNGMVREVEFSAVYIKIGGEDVLLSVLTDTTERNRIQAQVILNDKLAIIGTLTSGVVHEINTPLTWVLGNTQFLQKKIHTLEPPIPKMNEMINDVMRGTLQIRDIVSNLKGFVHLEDQALSPVDLHEVINDAIKITAPQCKNRVKLEKHFAPDLPMLFCSRNILLQVFLNLIINALQSFKEEKIEKNSIRITTQIESAYLRVDISDTGSGITPENLSRIFDTFFTTKPAGIGTGLGLPICLDIVKNMGGKIKVKSVVDKGSTFSVYLAIPCGP
jgi:PAS domain S-box-containing protein